MEFTVENRIIPVFNRDPNKNLVLNISYKTFYEDWNRIRQLSHDITFVHLTNISIEKKAIQIVDTKGRLEKLLSNIDPHKAAGPDEIHPRVLKELSVEIAPTLSFIFTCSLAHGEVP